MSEHSVEKIVVASNINNVGMSATVTKALFPYSIVINEDFDILQIGQNMAKVLRKAEDEILGSRVMDVLEITQPLHAEWNWDWLRKLEDQTFQVDPVIAESDCNVLFKASIILVADNPVKAMLIMAPDASNLNDLMKMGLTLSDLPVHGDYRDAVFLREHLSSQMNNALKMEAQQKFGSREAAPRIVASATCSGWLARWKAGGTTFAPERNRVLLRHCRFHQHLQADLPVGRDYDVKSTLLCHGLLGLEV